MFVSGDATPASLTNTSRIRTISVVIGDAPPGDAKGWRAASVKQAHRNR
jgi:hypothetical protein